MKIQGDGSMKTVYQRKKDITLTQKKEYLLRLASTSQQKELISMCLTKREFTALLNNKEINQLFYKNALQALYKSTTFQQIEEHLKMMNTLFYYQSYQDVKSQLLDKLTHRVITTREYCVIRYLIDFEHISFSQLIQQLYIKYKVDLLECVKICLIEDEHSLAYEYLMLLDDCPQEVLIDIVGSYSLCDYLSLKKHFSEKKKNYQLMLE